MTAATSRAARAGGVAEAVLHPGVAHAEDLALQDREPDVASLGVALRRESAHARG